MSFQSPGKHRLTVSLCLGGGEWNAHVIFNGISLLRVIVPFYFHFRSNVAEYGLFNSAAGICLWKYPPLDIWSIPG